MTKTFTVYPENLTQDVKIAFALVPRDCQSIQSVKHSPIALRVMEFFAKGTQTQTFEWCSELGFSLWTRKPNGRGISLETPSGYCRVPPSYYVDLSCPQANPQPRWTRSRPSENQILRSENMVAAHNRTSESQLMTLGFLKQSFDPILPGSYSFHPMTCYCIAPGDTLYGPSSLMLQVYLVNMKDKKNQRLMPDDLRRPIFSKPLECDGLPMASTWKLSQMSGREFSLERQPFDEENGALRIEELERDLGVTKTIALRADQRVGAAEDRIKQVEHSYFSVQQNIIQFRPSTVPQSQGVDPRSLYPTLGNSSGANTPLSSHRLE